MNAQIPARPLLIIDDGAFGALFEPVFRSQGFNPILVTEYSEIPTTIDGGKNLSVVLINRDFGIASGNSDLCWAAIDEALSNHLNSSPTIIFSLSNENRFREEAEGKVPELFRDENKALWRLVELPSDTESIIAKVDELVKSLEESEAQVKRKSLQVAVATRVASQQDKNQRHALGNARAAARILNGAILSGDFNIFDDGEKTRLEGAYETLVKNSDISESEKERQKKNAKETIRKAKNKLAKARPKPNLWHEGISEILVIDDQVGIWEPVWKYLLGDERVDLAKDCRDALTKLDERKYDCVLLDLFLGEGKENGLEILQIIKKKYFDMPVVIMTAYDDGDVLSRCFKFGAESYFCKEREDRDDRDSVKYYEKLCEIVRTATRYKYDDVVRKTWREFAAVEEDLSTRYPEAADNFRKAYFFLTLDPEELRVKRFLCRDQTTSPQFIESIFYSYEYLDAIVSKELENRGITRLGRGDRRLRIQLVSVEEKVSGLKGIYGKAIEAIPRRVASLGPKTGHMNLSFWETRKSLQDDAKDVLSTSLGWSLGFLAALEKTARKDNNDVDTFDPVPIEDTGKSNEDRLSHEERGKAGAIRLLEGAYLSENDQQKKLFLERSQLKPENQQDIQETLDLLCMDYEGQGSFLRRQPQRFSCVFIDDKGEQSGWRRVLEAVLPEAYIHYIEYKESDDVKNEILQETQLADFVLLDLKLPKEGVGTEHQGAEILRDIKSNNPAIPIVVLTASDDSIWARRVMTHGAFGYFPKTNRDRLSVDDKNYFTTYYKRFRSLIGDLERDIDFYRQSYEYVRLDTATRFNHLGLLNLLTGETKNKIEEQLMSAFEIPFEDLSEKLYDEIPRHLKMAFFYYTPDRNPADAYRENRLLFSTNTSYHQQVLLTCGEIVEFCLKLGAAMSTTSVKINTTAGEICNDDITMFEPYRRICPSSYIKTASEIWEMRKSAKDHPERLSAKDVRNIFSRTIEFVSETQFILMKIALQGQNLWRLKGITPGNITSIEETNKAIQALIGIVEEWKTGRDVRSIAREYSKLIVVNFYERLWFSALRHMEESQQRNNQKIRSLIQEIHHIYSLPQENKLLETQIKELNEQRIILEQEWAQRSSTVERKVAHQLGEYYTLKLTEIDLKLEELDNDEKKKKENLQDLDPQVELLKELQTKHWFSLKTKRRAVLESKEKDLTSILTFADSVTEPETLYPACINAVQSIAKLFP